ncbi:hypothetical protein [Algoriphagus antarcticus]|uniref:Transposase IS200-like domain-containing protein n=1 Tax=Algoriphagus antarcticus TaxID=238540 RepID=A0A3E0D6Y5_9BACT|nr:hypothetical protein [Algoriphagus antarcticus]REG78426.1 hypothetical protein C8N25_13429 [Algoriphagus antarcticus]
MKYNPDFHHRRSIRLKGYDYSKAGLYFITIWCKKRQCFFGEILKNGTEQVMSLSKFGIIAKDCWFKIPSHYPNVVLHEFVVMPNPIHGIIEIAVGANDHSPLRRGKSIFRSPSRKIGGYP